MQIARRRLGDAGKLGADGFPAAPECLLALASPTSKYAEEAKRLVGYVSSNIRWRAWPSRKKWPAALRVDAPAAMTGCIIDVNGASYLRT
jgi:hypothetical protein